MPDKQPGELDFLEAGINRILSELLRLLYVVWRIVVGVTLALTTRLRKDQK